MSISINALPLRISRAQYTSVSAKRNVAASLRAPSRKSAARSLRTVVRAEDGDAAPQSDDTDFEAKLNALKGKKGAKREKREAQAAKKGGMGAAPMQDVKDMDFSDEVVFWEGKPATGDLAVNVALGATLLWLPLTLASIGRYAFLKYKFTDKRVIIESTSPLETSTSEVAYSQVKDVISIGRGVGLWGDMVITLQNGEKLELRSLERFKEFETYIRERMPKVQGDADTSTF
ncbi:hypothetical protein CYMTET_51342 [Cymbomonas tetramitiformis]|uniref:YdbS-like PH domain-containing protein n=1 Tax=Cymbomonas tetramitiformis TaxID=36881 RepID=A0AAE0BL91_9CHLO|nr:hypothetical protein CYMTET_51342 [Cymbomonas tetramitiformis]